MNQWLLKVFNIRSDEAWLVNNLFWLQFFQGVGVAIFNVIAFALFLGQFETTQLPWVYLFSACLLWLGSWVYNKIEHIIPIKKLVLGIILFNASCVLLFRLHFFVWNNAWFIFLMFSWYYVIYLLANLEFWGMAALLFDVRQSKRLFAMIGAGDIPAKLIGYLLIPGIMKLIGEENTLYFSFASMLISLVFYYRIRNSGHLDLHVKHEHNHQSATDSFATIRTGEFLKSFAGNRLIALVAFLSYMVIICVTIISFSFYAEVKHESHSNEQLADFITIFYAGGGLLALIVRLLFTSKVRHYIGTKGTLMISPVFIFTFCVFFLFGLPLIPHTELSVLYIFGSLYFVSEALKISMQDSVFLSLMQPLSSGLRLKAHTVVKGVMDPFGLATTGLVLLGILKIVGHVDLFVMCYLLLALVILWVFMIVMVDREYLKTIVNALNKRYSVGQDIDLRNERTKEILEAKVSGGDKWEAIYVLRLIENHYSPANDELIIKALRHAEAEVRIEALQMVERKKIMAALPAIDAFVTGRSDKAILPEAVKAKCMLSPDELESFDVFLEEPDPHLLQASITGLMKSGGISAVVSAGQKLLQLLASPKADERKMAVTIIGDLGVHSFYKPLLQLLQDEDDEVVKATITASGKVKNEKLIAYLLHELLLKGRHEKLVMDALVLSGPVSLNAIRETLLDETVPRKYQLKLILVIGKIGTDAAVKILEETVWKLPAMQNNIFHALNICIFKCKPENRQQYVELILKYLAFATRVLFSINELEKTTGDKELINALYLELNKIRDSLLLLFSFVYDREKMAKAKNAFLINKRENIANALEIIEIEVPMELSLLFIRIFEPAKTMDKCMQLTAHFNEQLTYQSILDDILNEKTYSYHRWTKATALYSLLNYTGEGKESWLERASRESDILLKEIGQKGMATLN